jgi:hypothetical protein
MRIVMGKNSDANFKGILVIFSKIIEGSCQKEGKLSFVSLHPYFPYWGRPQGGRFDYQSRIYINIK